MGVGGEKCDCAPPCVCVYVQKVADLKPGIELGFWEGWGAGAGREERTAWCGVGRVVLAVRPMEGCFYGVGFC